MGEVVLATEENIDQQIMHTDHEAKKGGDRGARRAAARRRGDCRERAAERARPLDVDHVARHRQPERAARGRGPSREARRSRLRAAPLRRAAPPPPPDSDAAPERRAVRGGGRGRRRGRAPRAERAA
ncbi:hypothetical protein JL722_9173 [Aureococcus anophagefferens]|nr:hypothetical protein JL722_9173 [Aureococcus anophagefferens]